MLRSEAISQATELLQKLLLTAIDAFERQIGLKFDDASVQGVVVQSDEAKGITRHPGLVRIPSSGFLTWQKQIASDPLFLKMKLIVPGFNETDFGLFLLALAPEHNSRFERVFGFLLDDITLRRASVELAISLLGQFENGKQVLLDRLNRLVVNRIIELGNPPDGRTGENARQIRLDEQFARWVFGIQSLDRRLVPIAEVTDSKADLFLESLPDQLRNRISQTVEQKMLRQMLHGPDKLLSLRIVDFYGSKKRAKILVVDTLRLVMLDAAVKETTRLLVREAQLFKYILVFADVDSLQFPECQKGWDQRNHVLDSAA